MKRFFLLTIFIIFTIRCMADAAEGEKLFKTTCVACHTIGKGKIVGPDLKDVQKRRPEEWLIKWIQNPDAVLKSGDEYAKKIFEEYNKTPMPVTGYSPEQVKSILTYITEESAKAVEAQTSVPGAAVPSSSGAADKTTIVFILLFLLVLFLALFFVLRSVNKSLRAVLSAKKGEAPPPDVPLADSVRTWFAGHKRLVALVIILLFIYGSGKAWFWMLELGVEQGYEPVQPIKFSHKIHVGANGIQCIYCHFGAEKSKTAGIPPANVCLNCHKYIRQGPVTGTQEIAKIYAALDFNLDKQTFGPNPKPIQWVKVHNLPDLAYFNHSQHVVAGKIACQTCHGTVDSLDVIRQETTLTMGWCVDCHRKTEVKMEGNPYYDELHAILKERYKTDKLTVDMMGGTECVKCHY